MIIKYGGDKMLTKKELAEQLKISEISINRYMLQGMPYTRQGKKLLRYDLELCKEWLSKIGK